MQATTIKNLLPGETGYQTAGGNLLAVSYKAAPDKRLGYFGVLVTSRLVTADGDAVKGVTGPITLVINESARADNINATTPLSTFIDEWLGTIETYIDRETVAQTHMRALIT